MEDQPKLEYKFDQHNPYFYASKAYIDCITDTVAQNSNIKALEKVLARDDINSLCAEELAKLREVVPTIGYKEIIGVQQIKRKFDYL